jgi:predicted permease
MDVFRDARLVVRRLLKSPGYVVASTMTLALAIGANTAIFSAVYSVLLAPLPIRNPTRLVIAWKTEPTRNLAVVEATFRDYERWRAASQSFVQVAAMGSSSWPAVLEDDAGATTLASVGVTATFFDTLGTRPILGRALQPEDDQPAARPVAVLSHDFWARHFGADPSVVGTPLRLASGPMEIVGVMPPDFDFPRGTSFWTSVVPVLAGSGKSWGTDAFEKVGVLFVLGRLRDGITLESATRELDAIARHAPDTLPRPAAVPAVTVTAFRDYVLGPVRSALWWLLAAVAVLLLVACANVSGLMLTRASLQRREQAIRLTLGATTVEIARAWVLESSILALVGGGLGLAASRWMLSVMAALAPRDIPHLADITLNVPVASFTLVIVGFTALLGGFGPIVQLRTGGLLTILNEAARGSTGRQSVRIRSVLATLQIALAVVLLISAGLIVRSVTALHRLNLGFNP